MSETLQKELSVLNVKLNRLKAKKAALETRQENTKARERMQRTRTLIQMGGLLSVVKIPDWFDIHLGDDLQTDNDSKDKSAMLLGLLLTVVEQLPKEFSDTEKTKFKNKGINHLRSNQGLS